jgi:hypothetical protein
MARSELVSIRVVILKALGLSAVAAGCSEVIVQRDDGAGGAGASDDAATTGTKGTGNAAQTSTAQTATAATTTAATATSSVTSTSTGGMNACGAYTTEAVEPPTTGECALDYPNAQYVCYPPVPGGEICENVYGINCIYDTYSCGLQEWADTFCWSGEGCCYYVFGDCPVGRPFVVSGTARVAGTESNAGWSSTFNDGSAIPSVLDLDPSTRLALAAFWTQEALTEHASVASFSRFVLQLLALGAPSDLVLDATRATADEVEHARIAFSFASVYAETPVGPTSLDVSGALDGMLDRTAAAAALASEGCVAETVSALQIGLAAERATDPAVRSALRRIAGDEMVHALLAWRALAWLLSSSDEALKTAVRRVFDEAAAHIGLGPTVELPDDGVAMMAHGYLPIEERRRNAAEVLATVVVPCAQALLSGCSMAPSAFEGERRHGEAPV